MDTIGMENMSTKSVRRMSDVLREALEEERRIRELLELMLRQPGKNLSDMVQRVQGR